MKKILILLAVIILLVNCEVKTEGPGEIVVLPVIEKSAKQVWNPVIQQYEPQYSLVVEYNGEQRNLYIKDSIEYLETMRVRFQELKEGTYYFELLTE